MLKHVYMLSTLFFWSFPVSAAPPLIQNVVVHQSYGTAIIRFAIGDVTSGKPTLSVRYGTDPDNLVYENKRTASSVSMPSTAVMQARPLGGLQADTVYYFRPHVISSTNVPTSSSWDCLAAPGGATTSVTDAEAGCDARTGAGWFRTLPLPEKIGTQGEVAAPDVSGVITSPPTPTLPSLNVLPGDTPDLVEKLTTCAANTNGTGEVQEVLLPAGSVYLTKITLPKKNLPGICIVRTDDMSRLPPEGARVSPAYAPVMATLSAPYKYTGQFDNISTINIPNGHISSGWYFLGLRFSTEVGVPRTYTVSRVSDTGEITIDTQELAPYGIGPYSVVQVWDVTGTWTNGRGPNGVFQIGSWKNSGTTFTLVGLPELSCPTGSCYTGGGKFRIAAGSSVCGATNTSPIRITTCEEHGITDRWRIPIASIDGGVLTISREHGIPNYANTYHVIVENSSLPYWNGIWQVASSGRETVTVVNGASSDCRANCGTVRLLDPLHIKYVAGNTAANGTAYYTVHSPTELDLIGTTGNGEYISGGVLAEETSHWNSLVTVGYSSQEVHFDRCLFQPGGWPKRTTFALKHSAGTSALINNYFDDIQFYRLIRPVTNRRKALDSFTTNQYYIATATAIDTTAGDTKLIQNNFLQAHGITVYAQENERYPPLRNGVIRRNTFYVDDSKRAGSPVSDGLYYPHRHHLEWKRGERFLIDGNRFVGGWIDYNACGPMVMATPRGGAAIRDLAFTNNTFSGGTTGFYFVGTDDRTTSLTPIVSRVYFSNNIFTNLDGYRYSSPHDDAVRPAFCGFPLYLNGGAESVTITHNLFDRARGARTQTFAFSNGRGSGLYIQNNILWYTNDENEGPLWKQGGLAAITSGTPAPKGTVRQVFDTLWSHSRFSHNIVIPGVRSTINPATFDSMSASDTLSYADCVRYFEDFDVFCGGSQSGVTSARQNAEFLKFVDFEHGNFRLKRESPARAGSQWNVDGSISLTAQVHSTDDRDIGPDHERLERAQGIVRNFRITNIGQTEATVSYEAPDASACFVDFAPASFPAVAINPQRVSDGGGNELHRSVTLHNLSSNTTYRLRLQCATEQPYAQFETNAEPVN